MGEARTHADTVGSNDEIGGDRVAVVESDGAGLAVDLSGGVVHHQLTRFAFAFGLGRSTEKHPVHINPVVHYEQSATQRPPRRSLVFEWRPSELLTAVLSSPLLLVSVKVVS